MEVKIMFKKICSLIIIALMVLSVIGVCSAGTVTLRYPASKPIVNDYRYSGDAVYTLLFVHNSTELRKDGPCGWWDRTGHLNISKYILFEGYQLSNNFRVNKDYKRLPGYSTTYTIPNSYIGETIYAQFWDGTWGSSRYTFLKISNYKDSNIRINFWDRGVDRDPHVDVYINTKLVANGENGADIDYTM
jgi:hypothetical protein